jgi:hypothetical protein
LGLLVTARAGCGTWEEDKLIRNILGGQSDLFGDLIAPHLTPLLRARKAAMGGYVEGIAGCP